MCVEGENLDISMEGCVAEMCIRPSLKSQYSYNLTRKAYPFRMIMIVFQ